jgi:DNA polymerase-3 subunit delta
MLARVAADLKPAYLLAGSDRPKIARAVERLRGRFEPDAVEMLDAAEAPGADAVAACNALGLFGGGGRLVLVDGVERWKAGDAKAIADYLTSPAPDTVLALVAAELKKDSPLAKACAKAGDLLFYDVSKRELPRWLADQFARLGATADAEACRALVDLVGDNLDELAIEAEKLAVWAAAGEITQADVEVLVAPRAEAPPWQLTDAWGRRDVTAVLTAAEQLLRSTTIPALVGRLAAHVRRVRVAQRLDAAGERSGAVAAALKLRSEFQAKKLVEQSRTFSSDELDSALVVLAHLDFATKGGTRLPDDLELERALVAITRPRESPAHRSPTTA